MALVSWSGLSAYPHDARSLAVPLDRAFLFPVRRERLYRTHPCRAVQHRNGLDGLVLAAVSGELGRIDRRFADGDFALHALLRKICSRGCIHGLIRAFDALFDPALS